MDKEPKEYYWRGFADGLQWVVDQYCAKEVKEGARRQIKEKIVNIKQRIIKVANEDQQRNSGF